MKRQLLFSLLTIGLIGGLSGGGLFAHFMDTESSLESTFEAGIWQTNLLIDVDGLWYDDDSHNPGDPDVINGPFPVFGEVTDIKPCHGGEERASIHFEYAAGGLQEICILLRDYLNDEGVLHEPEVADGDTTAGDLTDPNDGAGELDEYLRLEFWFVDEGKPVTTWPGYPLIWSGYPADLVYDPVLDGWPIPNTPIEGLDPNQIYYVDIVWHLDQNPGVNIVMGDSWGCCVVIAAC